MLPGFTKDGRLVNGGGLGWSPAQFWAATLAEFTMAIEADEAEPHITQADARAVVLAAGKTIFGE